MTSPAVQSALPSRPSLILLVAMSAMGPIALNIFVPSMPGLQVSLGTDYATAQLTLTLYLGSLAVSQLMFGPLSDRFGRRPVFLAGAGLFIAASFLSALAISIEQLIAGRILQAAGGCAGIVMARAIVRDLYARDKSASVLGYVTMAMVVIPSITPAIGGLLDELAGWRTGFIVVGFAGLGVLVAAWCNLHETNLTRRSALNAGAFFQDSSQLLREPVFMGYALNSAFGSAIFFTFMSIAPFIATELINLTPSQFGYHFFMVALGYMSGNFCSGRFSERAGANRMIAIGNIIMLAGMSMMVGFALTGFHGPFHLFVPMAIVAFSNGLTIPNATASAISVRPDIAGTGAGLTGFFQIGIGALTSLAVSLLHDGTRMPLAVLAFAAGVLATLAMLMAFWADRRKPGTKYGS